MKRNVYIILIISILILALTACGSETITRSVKVEGSIFGGNSGESVEEELSFNPDWLTKGNNTKYSKDLASFAALLSADTYFREKDLAKGTQNRVLIDGLNADEYTWTTMLTDLGFTDVRHIESFKEKDYDFDQNDSVTMNLGYMQSGNTDIYVAAIRGCFSSGEWVSSFDLGADCPEYVDLTGEHPEWLGKDTLKGLDVAATRALQFVVSYISEHEASGRDICVLVTGHSRGGSIAQIVGSYMEDINIRSYTYTFNSLPCCSNDKAPEYKTIFNIVDEGDFFGGLFCFSGEPLYRYGATLSGRSEGTVMSSEDMSEYSDLFGKHFKDRASLYEMKTVTETKDDVGTAASRNEELSAIIGAEGLGLEPLCTLNMSGNASLDIEYCNAAQIQCIGKVLTYGASAADAAKSLFEADKEFCEIIDFITAHFTEISGGHLLVNTYELSKTVK